MGEGGARRATLRLGRFGFSFVERSIREGPEVLTEGHVGRGDRLGGLLDGHLDGLLCATAMITLRTYLIEACGVALLALLAAPRAVPAVPVHVL